MSMTWCWLPLDDDGELLAAENDVLLDDDVIDAASVQHDVTVPPLLELICGQLKALVCDVNGCLKQNSLCDDAPPASDDSELCRLLAAAANDDMDVEAPPNAPSPSGGCLFFCGLAGSVKVKAVDEGVGSVCALDMG